MLINGKKGIAAEQLVVIILVIASFLLIAGVVTRALAKADDKQAEVLCKDSIALRATTTINVNRQSSEDSSDYVRGEVKLVPPLCKTIDKKVQGDREQIKSQIANSMARCWWMFGEGRYEEILHSGAIMPAVFNLDQTENKCFVCYAELIKEDSFEPITTQELYRYLSTAKHPTVKDMTYLEYIQQYGGPGAVQLLENIEPQHAYGISFLAKNKEKKGTFWGGVEKTVGGASLAIVAGVFSAACVGTVVCAVIVGVPLVSGSVLLGAGWGDFKAQLYETEREVSMITVDNLTTAQQNCFKGDLAGK